MAEKEFDQLTPEEKKARFQKAFDDYNSGFVEVDYALRSVASIRVEEALEDAGRGLEEFKPAQRRVLFEAAKADLNMEHYMNPKFSASHMKFIMEQEMAGNWECKELRQKIYEMINWWLEKGIAGFRIDAITFIKKDLSFASRPTNDGELYPVEKLTDYKGIGTFLDEMKEQCFDKYNCMTVAEAPGVDDAAFERYAGKNGYFSMIFDFGWENMEGENDKSSIHAVERWKKKMFTHVAHNSGIGWSAIFLENHDQSRCLNKFLERENISFYSASALASIYFFLYGTPFIYQGQEIGMTNVKWKNINDMDDIRAKRTYEEAVGQGKDPEEVLAYFSELGRDNARTPMQWDDSENGGFTCGKPWIKCNDNYRTINVQSEVNDPDSLYNYYKRLIQCYHDHADIVRQAEFRPMYEEYPGLFAYEREVDGKGLLVIVNFTNEKLMFQKIDQKCVLCNYHETESEWLQPYEARIYSK